MVVHESRSAAFHLSPNRRLLLIASGGLHHLDSTSGKGCSVLKGGLLHDVGEGLSAGPSVRSASAIHPELCFRFRIIHPTASTTETPEERKNQFLNVTPCIATSSQTLKRETTLRASSCHAQSRAHERHVAAACKLLRQTHLQGASYTVPFSIETRYKHIFKEHLTLFRSQSKLVK